jgi:hypothetical protein
MAQVNTWSSFLLLPFIVAAVMVVLPLPQAAQTVETLMPSSQALQSWGALAYGLPWWRLQRREV